MLIDRYRHVILVATTLHLHIFWVICNIFFINKWYHKYNKIEPYFKI